MNQKYFRSIKPTERGIRNVVIDGYRFVLFAMHNVNTDTLQAAIGCGNTAFHANINDLLTRLLGPYWEVKAQSFFRTARACEGHALK